MPLQATSGAASYDAFGGGVAAVPNYIEDVFSVWNYTGNGSTQTITNGIDLAGKGGLVWIKDRSSAQSHNLYDTLRGATKRLVTNATLAQITNATSLTSFNTDGFSSGAYAEINASGDNYTSWTFRKQPKFFDVVTYTGAGDGTTVSHNLGSTPGCVIVKATNGVDGWFVYHKDLLSAPPTNRYLRLDKTDATAFLSSWISVSDTTITFPTAYGPTASGGTSYVAYLFAHNAGGFGLTGTDNVISCGSFTTDGSGNATVNLGYEPQWVMIKASSSTSNWAIGDNMRGMPASSSATSATAAGARLFPNEAGAETDSNQSAPNATATGFNFSYTAKPNVTFIYIAIRRGPMKVPTSGTSVFSPVTRTGTGTDTTISGVGFAPDAVISKTRGVGPPTWWDKLRGAYPWLKSSATDAEGTTTTNALLSYTNDGVNVGTDGNQGNINYSGFDYITYFLRRAPSFFDEVCYTGTGSARTISHNLGVAPELIFIKCRSAANQGLVYNKTITAEKFLTLFSTSEGAYAAQGPDSGPFNSTEPTSSVFSVGTYSNTNGSGATYVAYLFATCPGVSKVGTYTGTGATLQIDCGFAAGARFVLIKRTSYPASGNVAGGWYVWDSARGIVSGNDPYLLLNTTDAEVTNTDYIDTYNAGFEISSTAPIQINESGKTYIYLAIA